MGQGQSRSESPPLTKRPWRVTRGWSEEIRRELKEHVVGLAPEIRGDLEIPFFNILLTGQIKAGKSSFYNSLRNVFRERVALRAEVGSRAESLTSEYRVYEMRLSPNAPPLSFRICDTMGLNNEVANELDIRNILKAVDGHVPNGFVFDKERQIVPDTPGYINLPSLPDKAHCVAVVIDASLATVMSEEMWKKLRSLRSGLIDRKVPTFILLTHIDMVCKEVNSDVTKVYHTTAIRDLVTKVGKLLNGLPENQIFPVINYVEEIEMNDNMDILLLTALRQMLYLAQGYLENRSLLQGRFIMGNKGSKSKSQKAPKPSPKRISLKSWKKIKEKASKKELIEDIKQMAPKTSKRFPKLPYYNILLTGQISSGKSSFFNSINSIFTNRVFQKAELGSKAQSLTKEFRVYEIKDSASSNPCHFRIMDTPGLVNTTEEDYNEHDVRNILSCVDGNVPDKYEFKVGEEFVPDCPEFIHNPPLKDKAHCVCIIVDASLFTQLGKEVLRKIKSLMTGLANRKLPILILLTKIDLFGCPSVDYKLVNVFRSTMIRDECIKPIRENLKPYVTRMEQFLPIKNYVQEIEFDDNTDVLLLFALSEMLKSSQAFLASK